MILLLDSQRSEPDCSSERAGCALVHFRCGLDEDKIRYPSSMKLSVTKRVYRDGVLDSRMSSRQVHGTTLAVGNQYLSLGWFDPDVTSSEPQGKLKIFGAGGTIWIKKPSEGSFGGFIDVPKTGEIAIEKQELVMELAYGSGSPRSSLGLGTAAPLRSLPVAGFGEARGWSRVRGVITAGRLSFSLSLGVARVP